VENEPEVAGILEEQSVDTNQEIENLKKEIEELKNQPSSTSVVQPPPSAPTPTPAPAPHLTPPPTVETWQELESKWFADATQKGWPSLILTNSQGEKRYYRKEGDKWVRKNSEAEISQPYVPPAPPPTFEQLSNLRRFCLLDVNIQALCDDPIFMPSYYSNLIFRTKIDELYKKLSCCNVRSATTKNCCRKTNAGLPHGSNPGRSTSA